MPKGQGTHSKVSNSYSWVNPVLQGQWSKMNHLRSLIKRIQITWTLSILTEEWSMVHCMPCKTQILSKNEKLKFEIFCKGRPFDFHFRVGFPCRSTTAKAEISFFQEFLKNKNYQFFFIVNVPKGQGAHTKVSNSYSCVNPVFC